MHFILSFWCAYNGSNLFLICFSIINQNILGVSKGCIKSSSKRKKTPRRSECVEVSEEFSCDCFPAVVRGTQLCRDLDRCHLTSAQSCGSLRSAAPVFQSVWGRTGTWSCSPQDVCQGRSHRFQLQQPRKEKQ